MAAATGGARGSTPLLWWMLGLFGMLAGASWFLNGPQVQADEGSYLLSAAMIVGRSILPTVDYYSGYSVLLLPAFAFSRDPDAIYHGALLINALMIATVPLALFRLTSSLWPRLETGVRARAALAATCYAPVLVLSQYTMSDNALICLHAWLLAMAASLLRQPRMAAGVTFGAIAGALFLVHPRGLVTATAVLAVLSLAAVRLGRIRPAMVLAWVMMFAVSMLHGPLERIAGTLHNMHGGYSPMALLERLASPSAWPWLLSNFVGCTTDAVVASLGLFVIALRCVAAELRADRWSSPSVVLMAAVVAMGAGLFSTAAFFVPPERADQLAYGRYALPALVPLIAAGLVRLQDEAARGRDLLWVFATAVVGVGITALAYEHLPPAAKANWNQINSPLLHLSQQLLPKSSAWMAILACFAGASSIIALAWRGSANRARAAFVVLNLAAFATFSSTTTYPGGRYFTGDRQVVGVARAFADGTSDGLCLDLDPALDGWQRTDLGWRLFPQIANVTNGCVRGVIQRLDAPAPADMRFVAVERPSPLPHSAPLALYVTDGPEVEAFASDHALLSIAALAPLAPADRSAKVTLEQPALRVETGATLDVRIRVVNGSSLTLTTVDPRVSANPILVGAYVESTNGQMNFRASLPRPIAPAQGIEASLQLGPFDQPGRYAIHVGVVQELVAWFDGGVDTTIEVAARP